MNKLIDCNLRTLGMIFLSCLLIVPVSFVSLDSSVEAKGKKVSCGKNANGYVCYKLDYYITPSQTKALSKQTKKLQTASAISQFIGLTGLGPGIVTLSFGSAVTANQVFIDAAKQGKGVQVSYVNHQSVSTPDSYNTNGSYTIK
ncbi:hypothetical protein NL504_26170 [Klebsiella pneumoniae]|nr:hypothetical protein [Klebsiella pneumoniae]MCP6651757.1 hypothetical protein [Klebsiella pneumoniae]